MFTVYSNTLMTSLNSRAHIGPRAYHLSAASSMHFRSVDTETEGDVTSRGAAASGVTEDSTAASGKSGVDVKYVQVSSFLLSMGRLAEH